MGRLLLLGAALALIAGLAALTRAYVPVWQSDASLWRHAVEHAPLKPKPLVNYGVVLLASGRLEEADAAFRRAEALARAPHVPAWDRRDVDAAVTADRQAIALLRGASR